MLRLLQRIGVAPKLRLAFATCGHISLVRDSTGENLMRMLAIASLAVIAATSAQAAPPVGGSGLAAHRAVYDLSLKDASERSGISGMVGRMV
jgi:hypothetical protein